MDGEVADCRGDALFHGLYLKLSMEAFGVLTFAILWSIVTT